MNSELKDFYETYDENERLGTTNAKKVEFLTTIHFLDNILPPNSKILDVCAGCGKYAFHLAEQGHEITACDLVQKHVENMKAHKNSGKLKDIRVANALDLSQFDNNSFDVVLCMGALYHLHDEKDRVKCVEECLRVLKPGGIFAFAYISRNSVYITRFADGVPLKECGEIWSEGKAMEVFYCMDFGEHEQLAAKFNLKKITDIGVDGLIYPLFEKINSLNAKDFERFMQYHLATCEQPSLIGHSAHGLWIGKKENNHD